VTPAAALAVSRDFFRGYELCSGNGLPYENGTPNAPIAGLVCLAFSIELSLKSLLLSEDCAARGHDLEDLFGKLTPELQSQIVTESCITEDSFRANLRNAANSFEYWRYIHEKPGAHSAPVLFLEWLHRSVTALAVERVNLTRTRGREA
jgi:hypothetical protein